MLVNIKTNVNISFDSLCFLHIPKELHRLSDEKIKDGL